MCNVGVSMRLTPPAILNFKEINPFIDIKDSPFYIVQQTKDWIRLKDKDGNEIPRRAGVSSFGFGGANAHVLFEEAPQATTKRTPAFKPYYLFTLSAKTQTALKQKALELAAWLKKQDKQSINDDLLECISYTLNAGRNHFDKRIAIVASSLDELVAILDTINRGEKSDAFFINLGKLPPYDPKLEEQLGELQNNLSSTIENKEDYKKKLLSISELFIKGYDIDWKTLHNSEVKTKISLPTYPFDEERYWVPEAKKSIITATPIIANLHPLLDNHISISNREYFTKTLTGKEFYLTDHRINANPILPGVVYIEMARAAGSIASKKQLIGFRNIVWTRPIQITDQPKLTTIVLSPESPEKIHFEILTESKHQDASDTNQRILHAQGNIIYGESPLKQLPPLDLKAIRDRCPQQKNKMEIYTRIKALGLDLGPSLQVIEEIKNNDREIIAQLKLPNHLLDTANQFGLHPTLLDGSLQMAFILHADGKSLFLPFNIGVIEIYRELPSACYAYAHKTSTTKNSSDTFEVFLVDATGNILVHMKDVLARAIQIEETNKAVSNVYYYQPTWEVRVIHNPELNILDPLIIFDDSSDLLQRLKGKLPNVSIIQVKSGETYRCINDTEYVINRKHSDDYIKLISQLKHRQSTAKLIIINTNLTPTIEFSSQKVNDQLAQSYYELLYLSQALLQTMPKEQIQILCTSTNNESYSPYAKALTGFTKGLRSEHPHLVCKVILIEGSLGATLDKVLSEFGSMELDIYYDKNRVRYARTICDIKYQHTMAPPPFKKSGVYLITGGLGGLGLIFSKFLAKEYQAKLVLLGRSKLNDDLQKRLDELTELGAQVLYLQGDVCNVTDVNTCIDATKKCFGSINGIIHSAGVLHDSYLAQKGYQDSQEVLLPKVLGSINLHHETQAEPLDFFVMFSSISAIFGNVGQCDYAFANGFMDAFAEWRDKERLEGNCKGKTVSINWAFWAEGGMQMGGYVATMDETNDGGHTFVDKRRHNSFYEHIGSTIPRANSHCRR